MSLLDRTSHKPPLPERLLAMRQRIRAQMPRALWLGKIGAALCVLLSAGMLIGIAYLYRELSSTAVNANTSNSQGEQIGLAIGYFIIITQICFGLTLLTLSLGLACFLHKLYPYYYCQMLSGIHNSDFALLIAGEDIQREMDAQWQQRPFAIPLRGKLIGIEQHIESTAMLFDAVYLYSRHQRWQRSVGRYARFNRGSQSELLFRWSWVTVLLLVLTTISMGTVLVHMAIIYCAASPVFIIQSARLAAFLDNYLDTPALDPTLLTPLPYEPRFFARMLAPLRAKLPCVRF